MARRTQGEGSVYMRKDGRAAASAMYEGKRITKYGKTKKEAWDNLQAVLDDLKQGKVVIGPKQTVKQYLEHWLENVHRLTIELTSLEQYRGILRIHLIPAFGHLQMNQLTREQIQAFYAEKLDSGLSPRRIDTIHAVLSAALRDAVIHKMLNQNVCEYVVLPKKKKHKPHVLSKDECKRLIEAARGHRFCFLILMAITTGAREGELLALHWEDIDLNNLRVHIHRSLARITGIGLVEKEPKTASGSRRVVLTQIVVDAISEHQVYIAKIRRRAGARWKDRDLVFPNRCGGHTDKKTVGPALATMLAKAGLSSEITFHDLRHSAATLLFSAGINAKVVQEALGHSSVSITLGMYGDVLPDMQREVASVMDRFFE